MHDRLNHHLRIMTEHTSEFNLLEKIILFSFPLNSQITDEELEKIHTMLQWLTAENEINPGFIEILLQSFYVMKNQGDTKKGNQHQITQIETEFHKKLKQQQQYIALHQKQLDLLKEQRETNSNIEQETTKGAAFLPGKDAIRQKELWIRSIGSTPSVKRSVNSITPEVVLSSKPRHDINRGTTSETINDETLTNIKASITRLQILDNTKNKIKTSLQQATAQGSTISENLRQQRQQYQASNDQKKFIQYVKYQKTTPAQRLLESYSNHQNRFNINSIDDDDLTAVDHCIQQKKYAFAFYLK